MTVRAVSGLSRATSHWARSSRVSSRPSTFGCGRKCGRAGFITAPLSSIQLPRGRIRTVRLFELLMLTRHLGSES